MAIGRLEICEERQGLSDTNDVLKHQLFQVDLLFECSKKIIIYISVGYFEIGIPETLRIFQKTF